MEDKDTALVKRFQAGDIGAFEEFIQANQQRLFRLAGIFLYEKSLAEDAVQEVFIRAYKGLPRFQFRSKPFSWLYRTLKNVCSEMNKKNSRTVTGTDAEESSYDESEHLQQQQQLQKVISTLAELSRRERDVVLLRVFEEFSEKETAITLGLKKGTIKTLLHRGLNKIKQRCGPVLDE